MMTVTHTLPGTNRSLTGLPHQPGLLISAPPQCPEGSQVGPGTLPARRSVPAPMSAQAPQISTQANGLANWPKSHECMNPSFQL